MQLDGKVAIVTGGASGIGSALAAAVVAAGGRALVADLDAAGAERVATGLGGGALGLGADVTEEAALRELIDTAERELGSVDVFFANAGIANGPGLGRSDEEWLRAIDVNLMGHVRAARLLVPRWLERGGGYFVGTASAAGLLTQIGSAPYAVTKHAAVGFAEWLSVTYGDRGIRVSCLCPMGVRTPMLDAGLGAGESDDDLAARTVSAAGAVLEPEAVAAQTLAAIAEERFLILPHAEVLEYFRRKGADYERWLRGMRRLQAEVDGNE